jgi:alpha/beta superfamily hydrolase
MNTEIINPSGEKLEYAFSPGKGPNRQTGRIILLGHGVTGNMDRPVIVDTANALNEAGFDTLRFSFAGNGNSEGKFEEAIITKETDDLKAVTDTVADAYREITYAGHSMGSAVGVIQTSRDLRIQRLISIAGMIDTKKFAETEFGEETPGSGFMWDEKGCPLSEAYMKDCCETIQTVLPSAKSISIPWLLVHGTADDVVLPDDTHSIQALEKENIQTRFIEGADHSFTAPDHKGQLIEAIVGFLR